MPSLHCSSRPTLGRSFLLLGAIVIALSLTACATPTSSVGSSGTPTPTVGVTSPFETVSPTSAPTPTPAPLPEVSERPDIVTDTRGFDIVDEGGMSLFRHNWADVVDPAVATLTEVFGEEPTLSMREGDSGMHFPDYVLYEWPGFTLGDGQLETKPRDEYPVASRINITAPSYAGVDFITSSGISVGMSLEEWLESGFTAPDEHGWSEFDFTEPDQLRMAAIFELETITEIAGPYTGL